MRDKKIDIIKGIGIVLIVLGHAKAPFSAWFTSWYVQIFFLASGYVYSQRYSENMSGVIAAVKKRVKRLYIPWLISGVFFVLLNNLFIELNLLTVEPAFLDAEYGNSYGIDAVYSVQDMMNMLKKVIIFQRIPKAVSPIWFLQTLFFVEILYILLEYICRRFTKLNYLFWLDGVMCIFYVIGVYLAKSGWVDSSGYKLNVIAISLFIYHMGRRLKVYEEKRNEKTDSLFCCFVCVAIIYVMIFKVGVIGYARAIIVDGGHLIICSLAGWFLLCGISDILLKSREKITNVLTYIGQHSMPILLFHLLAFKIVTGLQVLLYEEPAYMFASWAVLFYDNGWWLIYTMIGVVVPLVIAKTWYSIKIKLLSRKDVG